MLKIDFTKQPVIHPKLAYVAHNSNLGVRTIDPEELKLELVDSRWFASAFQDPGFFVAEGRRPDDAGKEALLNTAVIPALEGLLRAKGRHAVPEALRSTRKKLLIPGTMVRNEYDEVYFLGFVHGHTWTPVRRDENPDDLRVLTLPN